MASIYLRFRASKKSSSSLGRLFFRITHQRESREICTDFKIYSHEWNSKENTIRFPLVNDKRAKELEKLAQRLQEQEVAIQGIIDKLSSTGYFTLKDIQIAYDLTKHANSFHHFVHSLSSGVKDSQERTARAYLTICKRAMGFNKGFDFPLEHINASFVKSFETHLKRDLLKPNTISFYMRNLRAIFNKAVAQKHIPKPLDNPFDCVFTGVQNTKKRALETPEVYRIISLNMEEVMERYSETLKKDAQTKEQVLQAELFAQKHQKDLELAQDLFAFSFFSRGMSFVDLALLRKDSIQEGIISYCRKKTGQPLEIAITDKLQAILNKYQNETLEGDYVFPIIKNANTSAYQQYQSGLRKQNRLLKELAKYSQVQKTVSTHVARHSWATIAKKENTPVWEISESLGHSSVKTTYIYLASFERSKLDQVNERVAFAVNSYQPTVNILASS